ncbi:MAG: PEP/pyruvate-binding domain-containing protein, partial [Candidatus Hodarchaeales archaeon]
DTIIEEYGEIEKERLIASSKQVSGNTVIKNIYDLVYVNPETFDKLKTLEIAKEVDLINAELSNEKRPYILIGFGRWGTFDRFLGIPVKWHNISGARVMIEAGLEDYQIEHSQGSHFFQNITTANIPYFYIKHGSDDFLDWEWLQNPKYIIKKLKYICLVRTKQPFLVIANGKTRKGHITKPNGVY